MSYIDLCSYGVVLLLVFAPTCDAADDLTYDFAVDAPNRHVFRYIGGRPDELGTKTEQGLLLTLRDAPSGPSQKGLATKFKVAGDFVITVEYRLEDVKTPLSGYGAGVMLTLFNSAEPHVRANLSHSKKRSGESMLSMAVWTKTGKHVKPEVERFISEHNTGRLRVARKGTVLSFFAADGDTDTFRELGQREFGSEPVRAIELVGDTGGDEQKMEVILTRMTIEADEMFYGMASGRRSTVWGLWGLSTAMGLCIVIGSFAVLWYRRR